LEEQFQELPISWMVDFIDQNSHRHRLIVLVFLNILSIYGVWSDNFFFWNKIASKLATTTLVAEFFGLRCRLSRKIKFLALRFSQNAFRSAFLF
jgi:hypothetical protein